MSRVKKALPIRRNKINLKKRNKTIDRNSQVIKEIKKSLIH